MSDDWTDTLTAAGQILAAILLCEAVGLTAAFATQTSVATWYPTLTKPGITPPSWLFGPVWTTLYAMMGVAAVLVWWRRSEDRTSQNALVLFGVQLVLNGGWSFAFFGARSSTLGLIVIVALWIVLARTTERFFRVRAAAGWLLVPYLLWVTYASALNLGIWILN
jgi:tryptophan-rich sensory protein